MDCIFCKIAAGEAPAKILFRDDHVTAFFDLHPAAPTHVLVIPNRHIATLNDLTEEDTDLAGRLVLACKRAAEETGIAESGYRVLDNVGTGGGQHVWHVHFHVLGGRRLSWPPG
ncbi:MAG: histidine triad nucleotide-binding protein [Anaerolineae bacterium]